jgi:hypothetical protein
MGKGQKKIMPLLAREKKAAAVSEVKGCNSPQGCLLSKYFKILKTYFAKFLQDSQKCELRNFCIGAKMQCTKIDFFQTLIRRSIAPGVPISSRLFAIVRNVRKINICIKNATKIGKRKLSLVS